MSPNPYQAAVAAADADRRRAARVLAAEIYRRGEQIVLDSARRREAVIGAAAAQAVRVLRTVGAHRLTRAMIAEVRRAQIEVALHALDQNQVFPRLRDTRQP